MINIPLRSKSRDKGTGFHFRHLLLTGFGAAGMLISGCQTGISKGQMNTVDKTYPSTNLSATRWQLEALVSSDDAIGTVRPSDPTRYRMQLNADGTANLELDCNRASGPWSHVKNADGVSGVFSIGPVASTRAMCPPGSLDNRIGRELPFIKSYTVAGERLSLSLVADGGVQIWARLGGLHK